MNLLPSLTTAVARTIAWRRLVAVMRIHQILAFVGSTLLVPFVLLDGGAVALVPAEEEEGSQREEGEADGGADDYACYCAA